MRRSPSYPTVSSQNRSALRSLAAALVVFASTCSDANKPSAPPDARADLSSEDIPADTASDPPCRLEALPDITVCCGQPGERSGVTCIDRQYLEMNLATCVPEGSGLDARFVSLGRRCCEGLTMVDDNTLTDAAGSEGLPAGCAESELAAKRCVRCGDGTCGKGENRCSCPRDCS